MVDKSGWVVLTEENPDHSAWYVERFRTMAAEGKDLGGEARFVDAMAPRGARILDAGCGPGRVGAILSAIGHDVVGVDVDPILIAAAEEDHPGPTWLVGDLAEFGVDTGEPEVAARRFDVIVSAGNVMTFLAPSTRQPVLRNLRDHLADAGRLVVGFGSGRDYEFADFFADADAAGLTIELRFSSWDLRPFGEASDFLVAVLVPTPG